MSESKLSRIIATPPRQKNIKIDIENEINRSNQEIYSSNSNSDRRHTIAPLERVREVC